MQRIGCMTAAAAAGVAGVAVAEVALRHWYKMAALALEEESRRSTCARPAPWPRVVRRPRHSRRLRSPGQSGSGRRSRARASRPRRTSSAAAAVAARPRVAAAPCPGTARAWPAAAGSTLAVPAH
ncbi:hypothetical protein CAOG_010000 [Capsaspora owczarzaki ATCC 30864]|uniref:Uncharacterized protein n=1 Tax=Capsaspora owczarzaki (strain ATCC 30864) TaxID=595528 RepID=A0A0D2UMB2_CAPO3|nr:hypothetical protein CAOG_010000 [Capsaspora owczarzaki ATCC 30864]